ncbi:MAG: hypothetical protein Q8L47_04325 [bacterium]|nr:hypothetical protein [bacterium]
MVSGACVTVVNAKGRTIISNGPVYELTKAKTLLNVHGLRVINEQATVDQACDFSPELNDDELKKFICALNANDYEKSERCATSIGRTIDCDAYAMTWNRSNHTRWIHGYKIYVKFGFVENNSLCLIASIHAAIR